MVNRGYVAQMKVYTTLEKNESLNIEHYLVVQKESECAYRVHYKFKTVIDLESKSELRTMVHGGVVDN
jgi:hypothetical protein